MRGLSFIRQLAFCVCFGLLFFSRADGQAGAIADCNQSANSDKQISGCTQLLKSRHLGRKELALVYNHRAMAYYRKKQFKRAISDFTKAVRLRPRDLIVRLNRGVVFERMGQYGRAIANYSIAIEQDPEFSLAYFNRANVFEAKGDLNAAIADYKVAIKLNLVNADAVNNLGNVYYKTGQRASALNAYRSALTIDPEHRQARKNLSLLEDETKQISKQTPRTQTVSKDPPFRETLPVADDSNRKPVVADRTQIQSVKTQDRVPNSRETQAKQNEEAQNEETGTGNDSDGLVVPRGISVLGGVQ